MAIKIPEAGDVGGGRQQTIDTDRSGMPRVNFGGFELKGRAISSMGSAIADAGSQFAALAERNAKKNEAKENFAAEQAYQKMKLQLTGARQEALNNMEGDGAGFHENFMGNEYNNRSTAFLQTLPPRLRDKYGLMIETERERWANTTAADEAQQGRSWYGNQIEDYIGQSSQAVATNPTYLEEARRSGYEQIANSPLSAIDKEKARAKLDAETGKAFISSVLEADPAEAKRMLGGTNPINMSLGERRDAIWSSLIYQESRGNPDAISPKGAAGIAQVMPATARDPGYGLPNVYQIAGSMGINVSDARYKDPTELLKIPQVGEAFGKNYLGAMLKKYNGDMEAALIAYNGGPRRADAWLAAGRNDAVIPKESSNYYKQILARAGVGRMSRAGVSALEDWRKAGTKGELVWTEQATKHSPLEKENVNADVVRRAERASSILGAPLRITSGWRGVDEKGRDINALRGGAKGSAHKHGNALDVSVAHMSNAEREEAVAALIASGFTRIGAYSGNTGIHVDMGDPQGKTVHTMFDGTNRNIGKAPAWFTNGVKKGKLMLASHGGWKPKNVVSADELPDVSGKTVKYEGPGAMVDPADIEKFAAAGQKKPLTMDREAASEGIVTVQGENGEWVNVPTVVDGKPIEGDPEALYRAGELEPVDGEAYATLAEAEDAMVVGGMTGGAGAEQMGGEAGEIQVASTGPLVGLVDPRLASLPFADRQRMIKEADRRLKAEQRAASTQASKEQKELAKLNDKKAEVALKVETDKLLAQAERGDDVTPTPEMVETMYKHWTPNQITDYMDKLKAAGETYQAKTEMETLSATELQNYVEEARAEYESAGADDIIGAQLKYNNIQKIAREIDSERKRAPDRAALKLPGVLEMWQNEFSLDPSKRNGETNASVIRRFVAAQESLGIPADSVVPIPSMLKIDVGNGPQPVIDVLSARMSTFPEVGDGTSRAQWNVAKQRLDVMYEKTLETFGDQADEVLLYALRKGKGVGKETSKWMVETIRDTLATGRLPDPAMANARRRYEIAREQDQLSKSILNPPEPEQKGWIGNVWDAITGGGDEQSTDPQKVANFEQSYQNYVIALQSGNLDEKQIQALQQRLIAADQQKFMQLEMQRAGATGGQ